MSLTTTIFVSGLVGSKGAVEEVWVSSDMFECWGRARFVGPVGSDCFLALFFTEDWVTWSSALSSPLAPSVIAVVVLMVLLFLVDFMAERCGCDVVVVVVELVAKAVEKGWLATASSCVDDDPRFRACGFGATGWRRLMRGYCSRGCLLFVVVVLVSLCNSQWISSSAVYET